MVYINEHEYELIDDPEEISRILDTSMSPFTLKKCLKILSNEQRQRIRTDIIDEVVKGPGRNSCALLFGKETQKTCCIYKLRVDVDGNHGKRDGIRVYCLVLPSYKRIILLGITSHKNGEHDLTVNSKKALRELCCNIAEKL